MFEIFFTTLFEMIFSLAIVGVIAVGITQMIEKIWKGGKNDN